MPARSIYRTSMVGPSSPNSAFRLIVAAAMIDDVGRVLVQKRPAGKPLAGLWEFPGGKIEPGESPEAALVRELFEELGVDVSAEELMPFTFSTTVVDGVHLVLMLYVVRRWAGTVTPLAAEALDWCAISDLANLKMPPADVPLVERLQAAY